MNVGKLIILLQRFDPKLPITVQDGMDPSDPSEATSVEIMTEGKAFLNDGGWTDKCVYIGSEWGEDQE